MYQHYKHQIQHKINTAITNLQISDTTQNTSITALQTVNTSQSTIITDLQSRAQNTLTSTTVTVMSKPLYILHRSRYVKIVW